MKRLARTQGFSLLEVLISMAMITLSVLMICDSLIAGQKSLARSRSRFRFEEQVESFAQQKLSEIHAPDFQAAGEEALDGTEYHWSARSEEGLTTLSVLAVSEKEKLRRQLSLSRSAWLSKLEGLK